MNINPPRLIWWRYSPKSPPVETRFLVGGWPSMSLHMVRWQGRGEYAGELPAGRYLFGLSSPQRRRRHRLGAANGSGVCGDGHLSPHRLTPFQLLEYQNGWTTLDSSLASWEGEQLLECKLIKRQLWVDLYVYDKNQTVTYHCFFLWTPKHLIHPPAVFGTGGGWRWLDRGRRSWAAACWRRTPPPAPSGPGTAFRENFVNPTPPTCSIPCGAKGGGK